VNDIAHSVICYYCSNRFDRDKEDHVKVGQRRYAHASCAEKASALQGKEMPQVIAAGSTVVCHYCKKSFNKELSPFVQLSETRYAHQTCAMAEAKRERTDEEKLNDYIMDLFKVDYVPPQVKKQINTYIEQYHYTYSGMLKALTYWHEIKKNPIQQEKGVAILPFVYKQAYDYYYAIWEARQKNEGKKIEEYIPKVREVRIPIPERNIERRKLFTFLDEEAEE
jgi:hypothetical protein